MQNLYMYFGKIYVDPFVNSKGEYKEYSPNLGEDYKFSFWKQRETEKIIIENPKYIKYLVFDAPAYQFMRYYYEIISGKKSKSMNWFLNDGRTMFSNPRSVELLKILLPNLAKSENFRDAFGEFIHSYSRDFTEIFHYTFQYMLSIKSDFIFGGVGYDSEFSRYFYDSWYIENTVMKTSSECGPFNVPEFCEKVFEIGKENVISKYVSKLIGFHEDDEDTFYLEGFFEILQKSSNFETIFPIVVNAVEKIYNKNVSKIEKDLKADLLYLVNVVEYCMKFGDKILEIIASKGLKSILEFYFSNRKSQVLGMFFEFNGFNVIKPMIHKEYENIHLVLSALENKKIIADQKLYDDFLESRQLKIRNIRSFYFRKNLTIT